MSNNINGGGSNLGATNSQGDSNKNRDGPQNYGFQRINNNNPASNSTNFASLGSN
tara:strand:+ start:680 stop:844 length:165 start_codon:yes stop_codon:yes gene_type:complete